MPLTISVPETGTDIYRHNMQSLLQNNLNLFRCGIPFAHDQRTPMVEPFTKCVELLDCSWNIKIVALSQVHKRVVDYYATLQLV